MTYYNMGTKLDVAVIYEVADFMLASWFLIAIVLFRTFFV
jgi:hypothetical protein